MRPRRLEFCGINSFSEPAFVDFDSLLEFGLFGIFGDTGSGKSTVLDSIGFALYGNVARSRAGSTADVINYGCEKASVVFEFEIAFEGKRRTFRVEREIKRKNAVQTLKVYERKGTELLAVAEGVREGNAFLERAIGLEQKDFEKCIALPQGEFAQFVKSARSDRLKLVSRLFDLEAYGDRLVRKANASCARAKGDYELLLARLEPYAGVSEEKKKALLSETAALSEREKELRAALEGARKKERETRERLQSAEEAKRIAARLALLDAEREKIASLERELGRLAPAETVRSAERELLEAERRAEAAEREAERGKIALREAEKKIVVFDEEAADEEIARLTALRERAAQADKIRAKIGETEARLERARGDYAEELLKFKEFDYEGERAALEKKLSALGEEDFFAYAETHGKRELLRSEYAAFAEELVGIERKYPETEEDVRPLVEKYAGKSEGEKTDFSAVRAAFEAQKRERAACREELLELEKRNGAFRAHCERLERLRKDGTRLKEELAELRGEVGEEERSAEVERALVAKKREKKERAEARDRAAEEKSRAAARAAAAEEKSRAAAETRKRAAERLNEALQKGGFSAAEEARELLSRFGSPAEAEARVRGHREEVAALAARKKALGEIPAATEEEVSLAERARKEIESSLEETVRTSALKRDELAREEDALEKKRALERDRAEAQKKAELAERLKKLLEGNKFMEFAAEEYLQNVTENASRRLLSLTSGRYFLRYDKGFFVGDNLAGGRMRGVYTLSGGETFLVSLSLALSLSAEICVKSMRPIEFFFLDEGFGTLDERLVDVVMDSLEKLKGEHFSIGIISHVEELKHRIERKLTVEKATETHGSRIRA